MFFVNIRSCFASDAIKVFEKLMLKRNFHGKTFSIYKFHFPPTLHPTNFDPVLCIFAQLA